MKLSNLYQLLLQITLISLASSYKILVHAAWGTNSHTVAMLELAQLLHSQNHSIYYMGTTDNLKTCDGYNLTDKISLGDPFFDKFVSKQVKDGKEKLSSPQFLQAIHYEAYTKLFQPIKEVFKNLKPDLVMCDDFAFACMDLAQQLDIPNLAMLQGYHNFVPQASYIDTRFGYHPSYLLNQPFLQRLDSTILEPIRNYFYWKPFINKMNRFRIKNGLKEVNHPRVDLSKTLVLVNSFLGFEPVQQIPTNFRFVGPIIKSKHMQLDEDLKKFMDGKHKVIFVAFGSHAKLNTPFIIRVLLTLNKFLVDGSLDGIVWGLGSTDLSLIPEQIRLGDLTFTREQLLNNEHEGIRFIKWAPQLNILKHNATVAFISHGGLASTFEAILTKTPVIGFPQFGDQFRNIKYLEEANTAKYIEKDLSLEEVNDKLTLGLKWALDKENQDDLQVALNRLYLLATQHDSQFGFNSNAQATVNFLLNHLKLVENCKGLKFTKNIRCEMDYLVPPHPLNSAVGFGFNSNYGNPWFSALGFNWDVYLVTVGVAIALAGVGAKGLRFGYNVWNGWNIRTVKVKDHNY